MRSPRPNCPLQWLVGDFAEANYPVDSGNIDSLTISAMPMAGE
jgi:hypothetical protein